MGIDDRAKVDGTLEAAEQLEDQQGQVSLEDQYTDPEVQAAHDQEKALEKAMVVVDVDQDSLAVADSMEELSVPVVSEYVAYDALNDVSFTATATASTVVPIDNEAEGDVLKFANATPSVLSTFDIIRNSVTDTAEKLVNNELRDSGIANGAGQWGVRVAHTKLSPGATELVVEQAIDSQFERKQSDAYAVVGRLATGYFRSQIIEPALEARNEFVSPYSSRSDYFFTDTESEQVMHARVTPNAKQSFTADRTSVFTEYVGPQGGPKPVINNREAMQDFEEVRGYYAANYGIAV